MKSNAIVFIVVLVILLAFWSSPFGQWSDESASDFRSFYAPVARNLVLGKGLVGQIGEPAVRYPPGFPIFLAGAFRLAQLSNRTETVWLKIFTSLAMGMAAGFLFNIARKILGTRAGFLVAILWVTYPPNLWLATQPNSEVLFWLFFYAGIWGFTGILWNESPSWQSAFISGTLFGCATLVRPITFMLPVVIVIYWLVIQWRPRRMSLLFVALFLLGNFATVMPWECWAHRQTGKWIPVSTGGPSSVRDGLTAFLVTKGYRRPLSVPPSIYLFIREAQERSQEGQLETTAQIAGFLSEQFVQNPRGVIQLFLWKAMRAWFGTDAQRPEEKWILIVQTGYLLLAAIGSFCMWRSNRIHREWILLVAVLVMYFWVMTILVLSILRYMVPVIGLLFPSIAALVLKVERHSHRLTIPPT